MRFKLSLLAVLALAGCLEPQPDGSPALGANDAGQVFTFELNGPGSRGGSCTAQDAEGEVSHGTTLFGAPYVTIRGYIREGTIACTDGAGGKYVSSVNQTVPQGLRNPSASAYLSRDSLISEVTLDLPSGVKRIYPAGLLRVD